MLKVFDVRDGYGIVQLRRAGLEVAVISGRRSRMVNARCRELGVRHLYQGVSDKLAVLQRLLARVKLRASACGCVGDDLPDLGVGNDVIGRFTFRRQPSGPAMAARVRPHGVQQRLPAGAGGARGGDRLPAAGARGARR